MSHLLVQLKFISNGFKPGFGSGLTVKSYKENGAIEFYSITDRGPNGDSPKYKEGEKNMILNYSHVQILHLVLQF